MNKEMDSDSKPIPNTSVEKMSALFESGLNAGTKNLIYGSILGTGIGLLFKRPALGLKLGGAYAVGRTVANYSTAFENLMETKEFVDVQQSEYASSMCLKLRTFGHYARRKLQGAQGEDKETEEKI